MSISTNNPGLMSNWKGSLFIVPEGLETRGFMVFTSPRLCISASPVKDTYILPSCIYFRVNQSLYLSPDRERQL
jgi:hypothetical protein